MPKLDLANIPERKGSTYPPPFDKEPANRIRQRLGDDGGLTVGQRRLTPRTVAKAMRANSRRRGMSAGGRSPALKRFDGAAAD